MVFDTMVFAYSLFGIEPFREDCYNALAKARFIYAPDYLRSEFTNVSWLWVKSKHVTVRDAKQAMLDVEDLVTAWFSMRSLQTSALDLAVEKNHSPYDALFAVLAREQGCQVITYDKSMLKAFPDLTLSVAEFVK